MSKDIRAFLLYVAIIWGLALAVCSTSFAATCDDNRYLSSLVRADRIIYQAAKSTHPLETASLYADAWRQVSHAPDPCRPTLARSRTYLANSYFAWFTSYSYVYRGDTNLALSWANRGLYWQRLADRALREAGVL